MSGRVWKGIAWGLGFATVYSGYATVLAVISGSEPFDKLGVTLQTVVMTYFAGGVTAGAIVGVLLPLRRTVPEAIVVGFAAALPVFAGIFYSTNGSPARWDRGDWFGVVLLSLVFGCVGARMLPQN